MQPLFQPSITVKKAQLSGGTLPSNTAEWPVRIRDEWAKTAPFASSYPSEIVFSEKDDEKGYALGHILVTSKTSLPLPQAVGQVGAQFDIKTVKVPIIVEDFELKPLDLIVTEDGVILPLNENRLREALFRPGLFDVPSKGPVNELFGATLYPPMRETNLIKANSLFPVLESISDTINADQIDEFARSVASVKTAAESARVNPAFRNYLAAVNSIEGRRPMEKSAMLDLIRPDVVLVESRGGAAYRVKTAMRGAYQENDRILNKTAAVQLLGPELVKAADGQGVIIIIRRRAKDAEPLISDDDGGPFGLLDKGGPCRVMTSGGESLVGRLLSRIKSVLTGDDLPIQLFSDGDRFGMRDEIGTSPVVENVELKSSYPPEGVGAFCWEDENGDEVCTEPLRAESMTQENGRPVYLCETLVGRNIKVVPSALAQELTIADEGTVLVPKGSKWIRLGDRLEMLASPSEANAQEKVKEGSTTCRIKYEDGLFHISGSPLAKLGNLNSLNPTSALFICGLMGLSKESAERAMARAYRKGTVKISGVRPIRTYEEVQNETASELKDLLKTASELKLGFFVKEAESLGDPQSVDAVLSLGFLNLDNVGRFVTYIPHLESTIRKLCLLLLGSRLGLTELPQDHLSRAISAIEHALTGLRRVAMRLSPINSALS